MRTQNLIISSFFDNSFNKISNLEEVENYRRKLYNFKNYIGITDNYTFFNDYYTKKMEDLESLYISIENGTLTKENTLVVKNDNKFNKLLKFIKNLLFKPFLKNSDYKQN